MISTRSRPKLIGYCGCPARHSVLGHVHSIAVFRGQAHRSRGHQHPPGEFAAPRGWLESAHHRLAPFTSFSEDEVLPNGSRPPVWLATAEDRQLAFFAGLWITWTSLCKLNEGEVTADLVGFPTTEPNAEVGAVHPEAMPVILMQAGDWEARVERAVISGKGASASIAGWRAECRPSCVKQDQAGFG